MIRRRALRAAPTQPHVLGRHLPGVRDKVPEGGLREVRGLPLRDDPNDHLSGLLPDGP